MFGRCHRRVQQVRLGTPAFRKSGPFLTSRNTGGLMERRFGTCRAFNHYVDLLPKMVRMRLIVALAAASGMIRLAKTTCLPLFRTA